MAYNPTEEQKEAMMFLGMFAPKPGYLPKRKLHRCGGCGKVCRYSFHNECVTLGWRFTGSGRPLTDEEMVVWNKGRHVG